MLAAVQHVRQYSCLSYAAEIYCIYTQEKDQMLKYVEEEVDRVKGLFEQKEARLTSERDSAKTAAQQLAREQKDLTQKLHKLESDLQHLPAALEVTAHMPLPCSWFYSAAVTCPSSSLWYQLRNQAHQCVLVE